MTFFSVLFALILEQFKAVSRNNPIAKLFREHVHFVIKKYSLEQAPQGKVAWFFIVLPWLIAVIVIYIVLFRLNIMLAFLWNVLMVYATLGFRQFSHHFTSIHKALDQDDLPKAREILAEWSKQNNSNMSESAVVKNTMILAVIAAHRYVFGVFFWFVLPIGPAGAVLYRMAATLAEFRPKKDEASPVDFLQFSKKAFYCIDWLPVRLTAFGFAIAGNFEDTIYAWRYYANQYEDKNEGVLLAASSGALGVQLISMDKKASKKEDFLNDDEGVLHFNHSFTRRTLQLSVGLVWRAIVLWMILLLLLSLAVWLA